MSEMIEKNGGLYWKDWNHNVITGWIEIVINTLNVIVIIYLLIIYVRVFECKKEPLFCLKKIPT